MIILRRAFVCVNHDLFVYAVLNVASLLFTVELESIGIDRLGK